MSMKYRRLTNNNRDEYDAEYDFCCDCKYFGEPCGCNRPNGTCDNYDRFIETYNRLAELEDKIEAGTLVELPVAVGGNAYTIGHGCIGKWDVVEATIRRFDNFELRLQRKSPYRYNWVDCDFVFPSEIGDRVFFSRAEAEKKLEEQEK